MITPDGREIDDKVVLDLAQKGNLLDEIWKDPDLRGVQGAIIKKKFPNVPIPEIDMPLAMHSKFVKPLEDEVAKLRDERAQDVAQRALDQERAAVIRRGVISEDDVEEVTKLQSDKGIAKFETAAEHLALQRRAAPPRALPRGVEVVDFKEWFKNPAGKARDEAHKVISEFRRP